MDLSQALSIANQAMLAQFNRGLSDVETAIVKGAWQNQTYEKIAEVFGYSNSYLSRDVGPKFWKILTLALGEPVSKNNFQAALERKWQQQIKQHQDREAFELRKNPDLDNSTAHSSPTSQRSDWGATIDVSFFYGRSSELAILEQWIQVEQGRVIAILGLGGSWQNCFSCQSGAANSRQF